MIQNTKCECGHQNHVGTVLCESCGKPLFEDDETTPLEMRYDGVARRSQKENPGWLDQVWNFFSSVKIAIYLIIITLAGAALGTVFEQESMFLNFDPSTFYEEKYGTLGKIYYELGLSHTYESWWFITLLFMIGISLVVCSLDRVLPLYRALNKQQIRKHTQFLQRQKVSYTGQLPIFVSDEEHSEEAATAWVQAAAAKLKKHHYRVHTEGSALLAEKYRFSRWGPYINHIGLIIFLMAVLMRSLPGWNMDQHLAFPEGVPVKIPETSYYLKNEKFTLEFYKEEEMSEAFRAKQQAVPKVYETKAILYKCTADCDDPLKEPKLEEVYNQDILVNKPLDYKGFLAYQYDFTESPMLISVTPSLRNKQTGEVYGTMELSMSRPSDTYKVGPYTLNLKAYFPDFALDDKSMPMTKSNVPNVPAFIFSVTGPDMPKDGSNFIYFPRQIDKENFRQDVLNGELANKLELSVNSMEDVKLSNYVSYLNIRIDRALPYIWVGAAISMIGLVMGFYWHHRRIWLRIDKGQLVLGAHTNKNWFGIRKEVAQFLHKSGIEVDPKSLEAGVSKQ
ncbi:cytochrome c biogenesis protein ResB [Paenibacillus sp. TAB 01]|uniref:cytochrome c biogenesis protein ResB n=1 Tax=Paenibacillus sp. TAB 01 TaxID=3368988 RepID=UPI003751FDF4